jgi:hypothetical protein
MHRDIGIHAERVPLSGAAGGSYCGDVIIRTNLKNKSVPGCGKKDMPARDAVKNANPAKHPNAITGEIKARKNAAGFKVVRDWLHGNDLLFLVEDRKEPIVAMPWQMYVRFLLQSDPTPDHSPDATPDPSPDATPDHSPDATPDPSPDHSPDPSPDPSPDATPDPSPDPSPDWLNYA